MLPGPPDDYEALCQGYSESAADLAVWLALRDALAGRSDWWFLDPRADEDGPDEPMWAFGLGGESRLGLTPAGGRFVLYMAATDDQLIFATIGELLAWLDQHEPEHEGFSPTYNRLLGPVLERQIDEWRREGEAGDGR